MMVYTPALPSGAGLPQLQANSWTMDSQQGMPGPRILLCPKVNWFLLVSVGLFRFWVLRRGMMRVCVRPSGITVLGADVNLGILRIHLHPAPCPYAYVY